MKCIKDYSKIIFLGGGIMAERFYQQIDDIEEKLIGVMDLLEADKRTKKDFKQFTIQSPEYFKEEITNGNVAVLVAIGTYFVPMIVSEYLEKYGYGEENLFVANPYTSLRFFCIDDDFAKEKRVPVTDEGYKLVRSLFQDELSLKLYELLQKSQPYDTLTDPYEILHYSQIKDMYYFSEDYWLSYDFEGSHDDTATILDCGAYNGDSILPICEKIPQDNIYYYAFEPVKENADCIRQNQKFVEICNKLEVLEYGVGETDKKLSFIFPENGDMEGGKFVEANGADDNVLEIKSLDGLNLEVHGTLYIKMDIEGSELSALKGAKNLIKQHKPYLAICLYHKKNDLLEIPTYLYKLMPDYKFYLRGGYHTILWAIPQE